jgi:hypothetical protein
VDLTACPTQLSGLKMDDRVERDGSPELTVRRRKPEEIALPELYLRIIPAADGDHARRQVDTDRSHAMASELGCHMARAAPQIGDRRTVFSLLGKAGQLSSVEWLSGELVAEALHVLLGDGVITLADSAMLCDWPVHDGSLHRLPLASGACLARDQRCARTAVRFC